MQYENNLNTGANIALVLKQDYYRKKISHGIFLVMTVFSLVPYIPSLVVAVKQGVISTIIMDTAILICLLVFVINKSIYYKIKTYITIGAFYTFGLYLFYTYGFSSTGNLWLFSISVISALLLGSKESLASVIINMIIYIVFIPLIRNRLLPWPNIDQNTLRIWVIHGGTNLILSAAVTISLSIYISGFSTTLKRLYSTKKATVLGLAKLAEHKDNETGDHLIRLKKYSGIIASYLYEFHNYDGYITKIYIEDIKLSSVLHDIGKVGIRDSILLKPGKLDKNEFEEMKRHTIIGGEVITEIEKNTAGRTIYTIGKEVALYHHEKWDGSGYPFGLKEGEIPLSARIVSIVDVYDALTTKRPYKEPMSHEEALIIITEGSGKHFDPLMVEALIMNEAEFKDISEKSAMEDV